MSNKDLYNVDVDSSSFDESRLVAIEERLDEQNLQIETLISELTESNKRIATLDNRIKEVLALQFKLAGIVEEDALAIDALVESLVVALQDWQNR